MQTISLYLKLVIWYNKFMSESILREKINETRLRKVEFSFANAKQIELKLILCYNKVIDKQEFV